MNETLVQLDFFSTGGSGWARRRRKRRPPTREGPRGRTRRPPSGSRSKSKWWVSSLDFLQLSYFIYELRGVLHSVRARLTGVSYAWNWNSIGTYVFGYYLQGSQILLHLGFVVKRSQCKISVNKSKCKRSWRPCSWDDMLSLQWWQKSVI